VLVELEQAGDCLSVSVELHSEQGFVQSVAARTVLR